MVQELHAAFKGIILLGVPGGCPTVFLHSRERTAVNLQTPEIHSFPKLDQTLHHLAINPLATDPKP